MTMGEKTMLVSTGADRRQRSEATSSAIRCAASLSTPAAVYAVGDTAVKVFGVGDGACSQAVEDGPTGDVRRGGRGRKGLGR